MMKLLTRMKPAPPAPIQVATRHIPFIETLWNALEAAKTDLSAKQDYLVAAGRTGVRMASISAVAEDTAKAASRITRSETVLERVKQLLVLGAEPTTPPADWFCGHIEEPAKTITDRWGDKVYPDETWPRNTYRQTRTLVFASAIPIAALQRYATFRPLVSDVRIYSPHEADFRQLVNPVPRDPVLIGSLPFLSQDLYFELARWDIDRDLAAIFGKG